MAITGLHDFVLYCIEVHGAFSFPELGTLKIERLPSKYSVDRKNILPPSTQLTHSPFHDPKYNLKYLGAMSGIEVNIIEEWKVILQKFVSSNIKEEETKLNLPGLGTFIKSDSGIQFLALENDSKTNAYYHYPTLRIQPLSLTNQSIEFAVENPKKLIIPGRDNQRPSGHFILPIIIIVFVSMILSLRGCLWVSNDEIKIASISQDSTSEEIMNVDSLQQLNSTLYDTTSTDDVSVDTILDEQSDIKLEVTYSRTKPKNTIILNDSLCIFVVGSFLKKNNAVKLTKKLKKEGFNVEMYSSGKFFRVGISLSCKTDTSLQFTKLQSRFPDIWVLE